MFEYFAPYTEAFLTIAAIHALATLMPGPDFVLILRNSLSFSKRIGLFTALGSASGMIVHGTYTLLGVGVLVQEKPLIFNGVRILGALYLMYIGWRSIKAPAQVNTSYDHQVAGQSLTAFQAWRMGFLCDVLNPMVIVLFLAIFSSVLRSDTPPLIQVLFVAEAALISLTWFSLVAVMFSYTYVQKMFQKLGPWLDRTAGGILILLGLKILWGVTV
jgi:threonine/homoserine/homoserine lactone efflux protein